MRYSPIEPGSIDADEEAIAHLLPCKHDLHNSCLKPWVERANSCPICRSIFNTVELSRTVGGPVVDSYVVKDKVQEAELDPSMIFEDELFAVEAWEPCIVCGETDEVAETMYCDGCDKAVHIFCAGYDESPEVWYCEVCLSDLERDTGLSGMASAIRRQPRRRQAPGPRVRGRRTNDAIWARVWQEVSRRLDLDLDFPFDDERSEHRTAAQRREFAAWQRRLDEAGRQGAANRLRGIAAAQLQPTQARTLPDPESQEEIRAWNAFDKARESQEAPPSERMRKRKTTSSPASPQEAEPSEQRQLKRPRLRRPPVSHQEAAQPQLQPQTEPQPVAESSHQAIQRRDDASTFLSSLLKDVENKPAAASSPGVSEQLTGHYSPRDLSPVRSPSSSGHATPRALSVSPPAQRPTSPPLSSTIVPMSSPTGITFSPFSPADTRESNQPNGNHRGRSRAVKAMSNDDPPQDRGSPASPSRLLSYSSKQEIQRMVKLALAPRYRGKEIDKNQYTDINRDVSRRMYDMIGDATALADATERGKWQRVAEDEVSLAIKALPPQAEVSAL